MSTDVAVKAETAPPVVQQAQGETAAILSMIERAARDPAVDIAKMERLFEMHSTMQSRQAEQRFNAAMATVQG